jgi:hypothetical protein
MNKQLTEIQNELCALHLKAWDVLDSKWKDMSQEKRLTDPDVNFLCKLIDGIGSILDQLESRIEPESENDYEYFELDTTYY